MIKRNILILLSALFIFVLWVLPYNIVVNAAEKVYGDYVYTVSGKNVTITKYKGNKIKVIIPSKISGKSVTKIGCNSFSDNSKLENVRIPNSVKEIEYNAFSNCEKLSYISLPEGLEKLGSLAFYKCTSLKEVNLPERLSTLEFGVFSYCESLVKVTLPSSLKSLPQETFYECLRLKDIFLPEDIEVIERDAFYNCKSLENIVLPKHITAISKKAFNGCSSLTDVILPEGLTTLGEDVFYGCKELESITLPASLKKQEHYLYEDMEAYIDEMRQPFIGCTSLKEINVAAENEDFMSENGILYNKNKTELYCFPPSYQGEYTIPGTVTKIMQGAFASQTVLEEISIPNTVNYIGAKAFYKAQSIKKIILPNKVEILYDYTFYGSGIEEIAVPEGVKKIYEQVFSNCKNLKKISLPASLTFMGAGYDFIGLINGCVNLNEISVAENNPKYYSESGILYSRNNDNKEWILCYPAAKEGKTFTLPKNIYIGAFAFDNCKYLSKVIIPEGITSLYTGFSNCKNLNVQIPRSVKELPTTEHIRDFALFGNCKNCFAIVYKESEMYKYCKKYKIPYKVIA